MSGPTKIFHLGSTRMFLFDAEALFHQYVNFYLSFPIHLSDMMSIYEKEHLNFSILHKFDCNNGVWGSVVVKALHY